MAPSAIASCGGDDADALQPVAPDRLTGHQDVVLLEPRRDQVEQAQHVVAPAGGQVGGDTAGADEVVVHPQAGDLLEEAQHLLALAPAVDHHADRADVHAVGGQEQQVAAHPVQLAEQHAHPHGALGDVVRRCRAASRWPCENTSSLLSGLR